MKRISVAITALLFSLGVSAPPVLAGQISSRYTSLNLDKCRLVKTFPNEGGGAIWHCRGLEGMRVRVAEGDIRFFVSYGSGSDEQTAARQTLAPFNTIHTTLEWRVERQNGRWVPFATILRYFWDSDGQKGQTLVITRLGQGDACHVAYVKVEGNPGANKQAREIADTRARAFDCAKSRLLRYDPRL